MNIAIVEDQKSEQERLNKYLDKYLSQENISANIDCFSDGLEIIDRYHAKYDIIYLDVEMEFMDGMSTARKIREFDSKVLIVFVTNHSHVAIQGYSVEASDFLLKPLSYFTFTEHFKKVLKKATVHESSLYIKVSGIMRRIPSREIIHLESLGHNITIHTTTEKLIVSESLKKLEYKLDKSLFFRCSNSYIVNMNHVEGIESNDILLSNSNIIPVSRSKKKLFMAKLTEWIGDEMI